MPLVVVVLATFLLLGSGLSPDPEVAAYAHFTCNPESGPAPLEVTFSAAAPSDSDEGVGTFGWSFGDGSTGSGMSVAHTFVDPGSYDVGLVVVDGKGAVGTFSRTVDVSASEPLGIGDTGTVTPGIDGDAATGSDLLPGNYSQLELLAVGETGRIIQGGESPQTDSPSILEFASKADAFEDTNEGDPEAASPSAGGTAPEDDAWIIEVTLVDARLLHALGSSRIPELGRIYVVAEVEVASHGPRLSVAPSDFQLVDASGYVTGPDLCIRCLHRPLESGVIRAGQQAHGEVLFEVRQSRHYTLEYAAMSGSRIRFRFSL